MTALAEAPAFTAGIYDGIPEADYHRDIVPGGSLSCSGAKKLLPPSTPARFKYDRDNPPPPSDSMELGTAAHKLVLGIGPELVVVDAKDWRTNAAKEAAAAARGRGAVPLLPPQMEQVEAMAAAIRSHPVAGALFDPERGGHAEQSVFWTDDATGIWRRSRLDWMPDLNGPKPILADLKTISKGADRHAVARAMTDYRYFLQAPFYVDGVAAVTGLVLPFIFCFIETSPPYLVSTSQLDSDAMRSGRRWIAVACERFRDCQDSGIWPGYDLEPQMISLPAWVDREDFA